MPRMSSWVAVLAVLLVASFAVAGCGSSSKSKSSAPTVTKAQFLQRANGICKRDSAQIQAAAKKAFPTGKPTNGQVAQFAKQTVLPSLERELVALRALPEPAADRAKIKPILDAAAAAVAKARQNPLILAANAGTFTRADQLAHAYGMTECGKAG